MTQTQPDPQLNTITGAVIGAAVEVHRVLGPGFRELVYENALAVEFRHRGISFQRQVAFPVMYRGEQVGEDRLDFLVENRLVVELKAVEVVPPLFISQVISYLSASGRKIALLINFNVRRLVDGIKRIAY